MPCQLVDNNYTNRSAQSRASWLALHTFWLPTPASLARRLLCDHLFTNIDTESQASRGTGASSRGDRAEGGGAAVTRRAALGDLSNLGARVRPGDKVRDRLCAIITCFTTSETQV